MNDCGKCANVAGLKSLKTFEIICGKGHQPTWISDDNLWGWYCETCGNDFTKKVPLTASITGARMRTEA